VITHKTGRSVTISGDCVKSDSCEKSAVFPVFCPLTAVFCGI
jgi:hypothetical protein